MGFLMLGSFVGFLVCLVMLLVKAIRKKPKKKTGIACGALLAVFVLTFAFWGSQPAIPVEKGSLDSLKDDVMTEVRGDITGIEKEGDVYFVQVDDGYDLITTTDVAGEFPSEGDRNVKMYVVKDPGGIVTIISFPS